MAVCMKLLQGIDSRCSKEVTENWRADSEAHKDDRNVCVQMVRAVCEDFLQGKLC